MYAFNQFLTLLTSARRDAATSWWTVGALFVCPMATASLQSLTSMLQTRMSLRCQAVLVRLIYRKALRVDLGASGASVGEVVNLMSADVDSIVWTAAYSDALWLPILQSTACLAFMFYLVGVAGFCALVIMATMAVVNNRAFKRIFSTQRELMVKRDERLSAISEALNNIRLIKVAAMEGDIHAMITRLREQELALVLRFLLAVAALISFINSGPKLAALSTFLTYTLGLGRRLSPAVGFTTLELLEQLESSFISLPSAIDSFARATTALQKLDEFLDVKEVDGLNFDPVQTSGASVRGTFKWSGKEKKDGDDDDDDDVERTKSVEETKASILHREKTTCGLFFCQNNTQDRPPPPPPPAPPSSLASKKDDDDDDSASAPLLGGGAEEEKEDTSPKDEGPTLREIALELPKKALVLVVGPTGCGKSSLVSALTNEIAVHQEDQPQSPATLSGRTAALVPQKAWCQHATFRQNVAAFGSDVDLKRYRRVLRACALEPDLKLLAKGDQTKIGSRGINLSGGQQARINLARCVYARPDVALLDDPLSAVDAHVAHHIFEHAILGELRHATRILVTHQVDLAISRADYVVFIDKGHVVEHGARDELQSRGSQRLADALSSCIEKKKEEEQEEEDKKEEEEDDPLSEERPIVGLDVDANNEKIPYREEKSEAEDEEEDDDEDAEGRESGAVQWAAYVTFLRAVGNPWLLVAIFGIIVCRQVSSFLQQLAMASWISSMERGANPNSGRMWLFVVSAAVCVGFISGGFFLRSYTQVWTASNLHKAVLKRVLGSKVAFFDVTPVGRIQNRFSSDFQTIDRELPPALYYFVMDAMEPVMTLAAMLVTAPVLIAALPAILIYNCLVAKAYVAGGREMKRLSSIYRSPVYDHFTETLQGLPVIRAFQAEDFCERRISALVDKSIRCDRAQNFGFRWLGVRLEAFGGMLGGATATLLATVLFGKVDPAMSGFVLQYATSLCFLVKYLIEEIVLLEISMNSMERLHEYANLEQEPVYHVSGGKDDQLAVVAASDPPASWPQHGEIVATDVVVKYPKTEKPVLNDLSFRFPPRTKTGIVGRTGAGKSTLTLAILR